jgi:hypothetical protein
MGRFRSAPAASFLADVFTQSRLPYFSEKVAIFSSRSSDHTKRKRFTKGLIPLPFATAALA